jgi:hypothetical protein
MKTIEDYIMDGGGNEFFPNQNDKILIDEVGKYSISKPYAVEKITEIIKRNIFSFDKTITDAFSCIGGDTLGFSKLFKHVNANELDKTRFEYLKHNMKIFNRTNITFYNEDYFELVKKLKQDVIYLDPPWGGVDYKNRFNFVENAGWHFSYCAGLDRTVDKFKFFCHANEMPNCIKDKEGLINCIKNKISFDPQKTPLFQVDWNKENMPEYILNNPELFKETLSFNY